VSKLAADTELAGLVAAKLNDDWSPQQIAQWLRREHPGDPAMWVSHESIHRDVYMPSRKTFDARMFHRVRSDHPIRRPRGKRCSLRRAMAQRIGRLPRTGQCRRRPRATFAPELVRATGRLADPTDLPPRPTSATPTPWPPPSTTSWPQTASRRPVGGIGRGASPSEGRSVDLAALLRQ
jgi:hypothetical protein